MSIPVIKHYYGELEKVIQYGGTKKETAIRTAFYILQRLNQDSYDCYD